MERPKCKLCFRTFANGRALGGHMKAHLASLKIHRPHVVESITSSPSSSSGEGEQESSRGDQEIEEKSLIYGLRENPKRSFKCADPEFSFSGGSGFAVVQDRESETESRNPTQRRSKRSRRKLGSCNNNAEGERQRKPKPSQPSSPAEPEPVSSVSDTSPEEDVAMCLMMLSRDRWRRKRRDDDDDDDDDDDHEEVQEGQKGDLLGNGAERKHHQCEVCKKAFRSSQALGGHRVIHRKAPGPMGCQKRRREDERERRDDSGKEMAMVRKKERVYECPFCGRVFGNGQALGGHKRSHLMGLGGSSGGGVGDGAQSSKSKISANLIDLNLPAPAEEDDFSVVSDDGEFTQLIKN
ncbi:zinc finger protein ZAT4-like [Rhodamnia argentea]|uniref:Zinc finger protein ZAT4-like n=1 Tax=Rhodamnia argentea TaxID=178133 RepID=A0A8B8NR57_9MYRT|nr:zinc finger protein ZAT4-like [Rhodamnia argentea]